MNTDKAFTQLKLLLLMFIMGTLLLAVGAELLISSAMSRLILLGLYTWSGGLFLVYKTYVTAQLLLKKD